MDNLNAVKEMVLDEDKIVTYISISKELCIHVNTSKMLLHQVVQNIRREKPNLDIKVSFIISGLTNSNVARVTVCPESKLEDLRGMFKAVHFEHIYSISKGIIDNSLLANSNYDDFNLCSGSIKNSCCIKHSITDINNYKSSSLVVSEASLTKPITPHKKVKAEVPDKITNGDSNNHQGNNLFKHTDTKIKKEQQSPKKESPSPKKENTKQSNQKTNNINKTQKGIAGFFNKTSNSSKKSTPEISKNAVASESEVKIEKMEVDQDKSESETKCYKNTNGASNISKHSKSTNHDSKKTSKENLDNDKNKVLNEIKKSSRVDKKRKRVLHVSDSESEDKSDTEKDVQEPIEDSDDEIPPTPMANNIKITSGMVNPKKKRKVVDKTFQDEEGYILTKKVEVYESCSEEENVSEPQNIPEPKVKEVKKETSPKSNVKQKNSKKKISSPQKGKQATLMNFFKRK